MLDNTPMYGPAVVEEYPHLNEALMWPNRAKNIAIVDQATYNEMAGLKLNLAGFRKKIVEAFAPMKEAAHKAHKAVCDKENEHLKPIVEAEAIAVDSLKRWQNEQERLRRIEQARLELIAQQQAEADRQRRIAEAKAIRDEELRVQAEQQAKDDAERLARAYEAEAAGASAGELMEIINTPVVTVPEVAPIEAYIEPPAYVAPVVAAPTYARVVGTGIRETWGCRITDMKLLCAAIGRGEVPENYVTGTTALNDRARADKSALKIPGVEAVRK